MLLMSTNNCNHNIRKHANKRKYHKISCKGNYVIYLLECLICKTQYIGKTETPFHVKLNNHRKDIKYPLTVEACKHFNYCNHVFHKLGKLILQ